MTTEEAPMTVDAWITAFAAQLGTSAPDAATVERLLDLAGTAARGSERRAAPIACYLIGLAGGDLDAAEAAVAAVTPDADGA